MLLMTAWTDIWPFKRPGIASAFEPYERILFIRGLAIFLQSAAKLFYGLNNGFYSVSA